MQINWSRWDNASSLKLIFHKLLSWSSFDFFHRLATSFLQPWWFTQDKVTYSTKFCPNFKMERGESLVKGARKCQMQHVFDDSKPFKLRNLLCFQQMRAWSSPILLHFMPQRHIHFGIKRLLNLRRELLLLLRFIYAKMLDSVYLHNSYSNLEF